MLALAALLVVTGCERAETTPFTAEVDEPGYRRGKELLRQGRNQEALTEFQKVIEKRGLNNAAESHLELGLLYQYHIRDPIAAIYHYRRYRELKPTSPQSDLVRQRVDAATREFARTLPAQPMENPERFDMSDVVQRLQRENEQLKNELARFRNMAVSKPRAEHDLNPTSDEPITETSGPAHSAAPEGSPIARPSYDSSVVNETTPALPPPSRPPVTQPTTTAVRTPPPSFGGARKHVIGKGDTLTSLAFKYYGNRSRWRDIFEANRDVLKSKDDVKIGMELKIPQ